MTKTKFKCAMPATSVPNQQSLLPPPKPPTTVRIPTGSSLIRDGGTAGAAVATVTTRHRLADSGSTGMYLAVSDAVTLPSYAPATAPVLVQTASNQVVRSTHTATLDWPSMLESTTRAQVFPEFGKSLISVPVLADAGLSTHFTRRGVFVTADTGDPAPASVLMQGGRDSKGLFLLPLQYAASAVGGPAQMGSAATDHAAVTDALEGNANSALDEANSSLHVKRSVAQLMRFYSRTLGNPADSTVQRALDDGILTDVLPGLTSERWRVYPPDSINTAKSHLDRLRQNIASTAPPPYDPTIIMPVASEESTAGETVDDDNPPEVKRSPPTSCTPIFSARYDVPTLHADATRIGVSPCHVQRSWQLYSLGMARDAFGKRLHRRVCKRAQMVPRPRRVPGHHSYGQPNIR